MVSPRIHDFAFLRDYSRHIVHRPGVSPYAVSEHRTFTEQWTGAPRPWSMCFGWSPAAVPLLAPFWPLAHTAAWGAWVLTGALLLALGAARHAPHGGPLLPAILIAASPTAFFTVIQGQTSLLTTAAFLLAFPPLAATRIPPWAGSIPLLLTLHKPPLAAAMGAALAARKSILPILVGTIATALIVVAFTLWTNPVWVADYLALLSSYNLVDCDPAFRPGFCPQYMSNLRQLAAVAGLPDNHAALLSNALFGAALAAIVWFSWRKPGARFAKGAPAFALLAHLLFCPHLTPSEDIAVLAVWLLARPQFQADSLRIRLFDAAAIGTAWLGGATPWWWERMLPASPPYTPFLAAAFGLKVCLACLTLLPAPRTPAPAGTV